MIKVVVDGFGGDRSPLVNVEGSIKAVNQYQDLKIVLTGDETVLKEELKKYQYNADQIEIIDAPSVIGCDEVPTEAYKQKKDSSLVKAYDLLRDDEETKALVSIGSTGAILVGSIYSRIGRIDGVKRPAFCPLMPTMGTNMVAICDSGANVDPDPLYLQQFAIMGSVYLQTAFKVENPRVALLNIGTEEEKGDALRKETYQLLKNTEGINFVGNMESRDLLSGDYDLIVCDGFAGNVLIKATEGACLEMGKMIKNLFYKSAKNKIAGLIMKKDMNEMKAFMDYNNYPGAVLLGSKKIVVKSHGSSKTMSVFKSVELAYKLAKEDLVSKISEKIKL